MFDYKSKFHYSKVLLLYNKLRYFSMNVALETLKERGFFQQCTDLEGLSARMDAGPITFYVGCDPTGPSLHIGHMVPFFALRHLRNAGHIGIALIGGGTARIGDPSGKTEMRKMISYEQIDSNVEKIKAQLDRFIGFDDKTAFADNNKNWLADLNYIDFLRDIGSCFSVNKMLSFEAYKQRLEKGLSFIEFNYQLLQSLEKADKFIVDAYIKIGKSEIEKLRYSTKRIKEAMILADFNEKARGDEVQKLIANSFNTGQWYSANYIKSELLRIFSLVGLKPKKAITSNTITDFFEAEKREHRKQRGYYLIRSRIL